VFFVDRLVVVASLCVAANFLFDLQQFNFLLPCVAANFLFDLQQFNFLLPVTGRYRLRFVTVAVGLIIV
jgi:hypothetical protein